MSDQTPAGLKSEDWVQTPPEIRELITRLLQDASNHPLEARQSNNKPAISGKAFSSLSGQHQANVLVVDDNEMNRDMLSRRLERQGHQITVAENGREALEKLEAEEYDLVLLDIMMPEVNGYEVLEQMKGDSHLKHIPVIMITAVDQMESLIRCIQLGAEDYLPKPFNPILLKARVDTSLEKKWLRDQQVAYTQQLDRENQRKSGELEQARQIQLSMLPATPPTLSYLDIAARQDTASEVGGDYYDFFKLSDQTLRIAIGDATGHGVASGLMVSMTKASLLSNDEQNLSALLQQLNTTLTNIDLGNQLNMALMLLDVYQEPDQSVTLQVGGGGMPPIYVLRATGLTEEVLVPGLPLGIVEKAVYEQTTMSLQPGDTLLLASDGLPERFNADREFLGFGRLLAALQLIDTSHLSAADILKQIIQIGDDWGREHPIHDDMTLVVAKVT